MCYQNEANMYTFLDMRGYGTGQLVVLEAPFLQKQFPCPEIELSFWYEYSSCEVANNNVHHFELGLLLQCTSAFPRSGIRDTKDAVYPTFGLLTKA